MPAARIWLDTYHIDRHEVTNGRYTACVEARGCERAGPLYRNFNAIDQPITGLNWHQAVAFCTWAGGHLPTEAEWEKAARGPDGAASPWGDAPAECDRAIIADARGRACGTPLPGNHPEVGRIAPVGSRPAGVYGLYDMVGNAEEWVADWWSVDWDVCGADCAGPNPRGPCDGADACAGHSTKAVRGGSWYWPAQHATGWHRRRYRPSNDPPHHFGFRCAYSVDEATALASGGTHEAPPSVGGATGETLPP